MTTTADDIDMPEDTRRSRLQRPPKSENVDDFTSAAQRIEAFWEKHPDGSILPEVESRELRTAEGLPYMVHTVRAYVRKDASSERPDAVAHATRGENDPDEVTRQFAQEVAETSAISRAIRNLGILATPQAPAAPARPRVGRPQSDVEIGSAVTAARERAELSQAGLAAAMSERGVNWAQSTVYSIEKGKRPLRYNEGQHLAELIQFGAEA